MSLGCVDIPRSLAQRFTIRMRSLARGSICPDSVRSAALWRGVAAFTEKSIGMASAASPNDAGANKVTFGSSPRKADLRNLNPPEETRRSVQARMADFRNLRSSEFLGCERIRTDGLMCATMSTSGTATPNALFRPTLPLAKPTTSTSGIIGLMASSIR